MSKRIELAKKFKELAERGVGGEKVNAKKMLQDLMQKHGITEQDLEREALSEHVVFLEEDYHLLFIQVVASVIGRKAVLKQSTKNPKKLLLQATNAQAIEVAGKFACYRAAFVEEMEVFFQAFVDANNLYPIDSDGVDARTLSDAELEKYRRAEKMARNIKRAEYLKQLNAGHFPFKKAKKS